MRPTMVLRQGGASAVDCQQRRNPALAWSTLVRRCIAVPAQVSSFKEDHGREPGDKDHEKSRQCLSTCPAHVVGRRANPLRLRKTEMPEVPDEIRVCPVGRVDVKQWGEQRRE